MRDFEFLKKLYAEPGRIVVTAHRGFSGKHPENTLEAFAAAVKLGVDFVEFDVRCSKDGVPVIMHDSTVDRSTDGHGDVGSLPLAALRELNASCWEGPHDSGLRLAAPARPSAPVPTLEEALAALAGKVFLNIQVYASRRAELETVCAAYRRHKLQGRAFLMLDSFAVAETVKGIDPTVDICVGEARGDLERHHAFGSTFIQPWREHVTPGFFPTAARLGLCANMFYANTAADCCELLSLGAKGIMSDRPDIVMEVGGRPSGGEPGIPLALIQPGSAAQAFSRDVSKTAEK